MKITTRISSKAAPEAAHHFECSRDHVPNMIRFTACSPDNGFSSNAVIDCMLYEIEDTAEWTIVEAVGTGDNPDRSSVDYESAREAAVDLASRADGLLTGAKAHVRHTVEAA